MPSEETIQQIKIRNVIGEKTDLASLNARSSLSSLIKAQLLKITGVPNLIHLYGALGLNKTLTFDAGEDGSVVLFSDGTYLYAGLWNAFNPGKIIKIDLTTFTKITSLTLSVAGGVNSLVSDGTYLYAGLAYDGVIPNAKIAKIDLRSFTEVGVLTSTADAGNVSLFSDGTYLYAGTDVTFPFSQIIKIDLNTFTEVFVLTTTIKRIRDLFCDGSYLYAGGSIGNIIKIDINTFSELSTLILKTNQSIRNLFSDGTYLYASTGDVPARIHKIDLDTFTEISSINLGNATSSALFSDGTYLYYGYYIFIIKLDLSTFTLINTISTIASVKSLFSDGTYIYIGHNWQSPAQVSRIYIIPTSDLHKRKIDIIDEQIHSGKHFVAPPNAPGILISSGGPPGYTKGTYTEVIAANAVQTQFFLTGLTISNLTADTDYEFDIAIGDSPNESVIATVSGQQSNSASKDLDLSVPIKISSNTRVSVACSDDTGAQTANVKIKYKI
jgi:hypothetical protein